MAQVSSEETYVAKLTVKALGCKPDMVKTLPEGQNKLALCRLFGKAHGVKYQDNKATATLDTVFLGIFEGINVQTGESLRSGKLYLPKGISEVAEQAIKSAQAKDENAQIAFAFEIRAVKATNPIGYSYEAVAVRSPQAEDELREMRETLATLPVMGDKKSLTSGSAKK